LQPIMPKKHSINFKKLTLFLILPTALTVVSFPLPLWIIELNAPMYAQRWLKVSVIPLTGVSGDVNEVNIVNHYVGLGEVSPEKIPEASYLPALYLVLTVLVFLNGLLRGIKRIHLSLWISALFLIIAVSIYLYSWLYGYTHTIHPGAPIKIEPFDPPFFGYYEIANFKITSYLGPAFFLPLIAVLLQIPPNLIKNRKGNVVR